MPYTILVLPFIETKRSSYQSWTQVDDFGYGYGCVYDALIEPKKIGLESLQKNESFAHREGE